ncbi:6-pyruvoyl trahydropterin synthase family protein [Cryptosporangium aurantiacum]|uniref:6-carboxy-5,6,7,8-tetrahydropterin synthase n=1 Tax=Cryptosporangium aurantiacum TaxID=134849 RepID=A0A1M7RLI7_9ACTN|nr:6-carboxytetrahydropterin synthase [Cryptosporangium aurantiacum]SHN47041.1 6-pyruvoyl-tetrahydropterin synthase [Cryptosporangium aurantiacum]
MYEAGTAREVRAFHVMPDMPPPEGERHSHDYRLALVVSREELDEKGMVVDLDVLVGALEDLTERLRDADLDEIVGKEIGADAVTVEAFANWVHGKIGAAIDSPGSALSVRIYENATEFGGYTGVLA